MGIRIATLALALTVLGACSSSDTTVHQLTSGTYAVSTATASAPPDANPECSGFLSSYQAAGRTVAITVTGTTASIDTGGTPADDTLSAVTINGNTLEAGTSGIRTITGSSASGTCNVIVTKTFSGSITADNTVELTYTFQAAKQAASGTCDDTNSVILPIPCSSAIHFVGTLQQP